MVKLMIIFRTPHDPVTFGNVYADFLHLIERMPNIQRRQVVDIMGSPLGATDYHRILEVYFADFLTMQAAMMSDAGQEAGRELSRFTPGSFELLFADLYEEQGGRTPQ